MTYDPTEATRLIAKSNRGSSAARYHPLFNTWNKMRYRCFNPKDELALKVDQLRAELERMRRVVDAADAVCEEMAAPCSDDGWNWLVNATVAYRAMRDKP